MFDFNFNSGKTIPSNAILTIKDGSNTLGIASHTLRGRPNSKHSKIPSGELGFHEMCLSLMYAKMNISCIAGLVEQKGRLLESLQKFKESAAKVIHASGYRYRSSSKVA